LPSSFLELFPLVALCLSNLQWSPTGRSSWLPAKAGEIIADVS